MSSGRGALATALTATAVAFIGISVVASRRRRATLEIAAVLAFWLEDAPIDELYDKRWFVAAGSAAQTALDTKVRERFGTLLARAESGALAHWATSVRGLLALIIVLDQLSRHVHRSDRVRIETNDVEALRLSYTLLGRGWDVMLDTAQLVFVLMPLRHTPTEDRLQRVLDCTAPRLIACESGAKLLHRFRRHTETRLLHLQGRGDPNDILEKDDLEHSHDQRGAADGALAHCVHAFLIEHAGIDPPPPPPRRGTKGESGGGGDGDELPDSRPPRPGQHQRKKIMREKRERERMATMATAALSETHNGALSVIGASVGTSAATMAVDAGAPAGGDDVGVSLSAAAPALIVSLSGGVDSMVLVHLLLALRERHGHRYSVHAVHIDYANRVESAAEAAFVRQWCEARGVEIAVRVVDEVKREVTARDEYEARSRAIRFGEYEKAIARCGGRGIFFGHHEGDLQENVISNVMKGAQLLNVAGIHPTSTVNGVTIFRPMLPFSKTPILEYAHTYGVPYFKDTTPKWSTRGKLRNELQPLLRDVYGEGVASHLTALAKDSAQCAALVEAHMLRPFWRAVCRSRCAIHVDCAPFAAMPIFFWREALKHVCEQMLGCGLVKERPIHLLIERLRKPQGQRKDGWLALKRENRALLIGTTLVIFASDVFPGRHEGRVWVPTPHATEGAPLAAPVSGAPTEVSFGMWCARLTRLPLRDTARHDGDGGEFRADSTPSDRRSGGAPAALWNVLAGYVRYTLPVHASYAVGSATHPQVEALRQLRGELWGVALGALPQIVGVGQPEVLESMEMLVAGEEVLVEIFCDASIGTREEAG